MTFTETFTVEALAPFNFDLTAHIFSKGDGQIRSYQNGVFRVVLRVNSCLVLVAVSSQGTVENPQLTAKLTSNTPIKTQDIEKAKETVNYIFNLGFDLCVSTKKSKTTPPCTR